MNENTEIFEPIECDISQILFYPEHEYVVGIEVDEIEYGITINNYDGAMLSFVDKGCSDNAHIDTIHQMLLNFKKQVGFVLEKVIIEAKFGDVFYCRLKWAKYANDDTKEDRYIYNVSSIGDALILYSLSNCELYILRNVLEQLDQLELEGFIENYEF